MAGTKIGILGVTFPDNTVQTTASAGGGGAILGVFYENSSTLATSYTISTGKNAMTAGPLTINDGVTVTVPDDSSWSIV